MRRMLAISAQAPALATIISKFFAKRRLRPSQGKRAFDDPAPRQNNKAFCGIGSFDDLHRPATQAA